MINYFIRLFLKTTRRKHLLQFLDGLQAIGKPGQVLYPSELLEQAGLLALSGLNNTLAIQSNQHWVWPYWVERQLNPECPEFIPTGVNLLTNNLTFRNWTALCIPNNRLEAMLDPVGMLTLEPFSWSVMPYLIIDEQYYIPSRMNIADVQQSVSTDQSPEIHTAYKTTEEIDWSLSCKAIELNGQQVLQQKYTLHNNSNTYQSLVFGISLRPYNALTIGHIHKISCKKNLWKINHHSAMYMLKKPDILVASNRLLGDPVFSELHQTSLSEERIKKVKLKSESGIATGIAAYYVFLKPFESIEFQFLLSDSQSSVLKELKKRKQELPEILLQAEQNFQQYWTGNKQAGLTLSMPDTRLQEAFYSVKNHLSVFDDVEQFTPGSFFYHTGWFRDSAFLSLSFDQMGFFNTVKKKFPTYLKQQTRKGCFKSQDGEWDSTGQALFTIISHIRRTGDKALLEQYYPCLIKGVKWIANTRLTHIDPDSPHYGLLPSGLSAEHFGPNDHYYWDNFWSLAGIKQVLWCTQILKRAKDRHWIQRLYEDYFDCLEQSVSRTGQRIQEQALPCSPYRWMDTAAIGNLAAISPMDIIQTDAPWLKPTLEYLWHHNVKDGLFFQHIIHSGYNIYLSIQMARIFLLLGDPRWQIIFKAVTDAASPTWTWPEAIHPISRGGCMGDGDHGWAAAEFVSLIRTMFIYEQNQAIYLGSGLPDEWFNNKLHKNSQTIELNNASTLYATVSYLIEVTPRQVIFTWETKYNILQEPVPVYINCPYLLKQCHTDIKADSTDNNTTELIKLPDNAGQLIFEKHFQQVKSSNEHPVSA